MIVHFIKDEKIVSQVVENFEQANPGSNTFLLFKGRKEPDGWKYLQHNSNIKEFFFEDQDINAFLNDESPTAAGIIVHGLWGEFAGAINKLAKPLSIYWMMWGGDFYSLPKIESSLYGEETWKANAALRRDIFVRKNDVLRRLFYTVAGKEDPYKSLITAHNKITACVSYIREDFEVLQQYYPNNYTFKYAPFLNIEQYVGRNFFHKKVNGDNVLIGNSGKAECNHLDVFKYLAGSGKLGEEIKIYVPLSYGREESYKQNIIRNGQKRFGKNFVAMTDFMPLDEYIKILLSCSVGVFFHYRQQGMGNIIAMLWLGARVYLSRLNPAFNYLKRIGLHVYTLEQDLAQYYFTPLTDELMEENRSVLIKVFAPDRVTADLRELAASFKQRV